MFGLLLWAAGKFVGRYIVLGAGNIDDMQGAVFVCNHAGALGPVVMKLYFPYSFRPWVLYNSMTAGLCRKQLEKDLTGGFPAVLKPLGRLFSFLVEPACLWVMRRVEAIPVYRGRQEIFRTFALSMEILKSGGNIALFPENADMRQTLLLQGFHSGFVHLARKFHISCGGTLKFYPVYVDTEERTMTIGRPVMYNPQSDFRVERHRVANELEERMHSFAQIVR